MEANNEKPYLTLRINLQKVNPEEFKNLLDSVNLKYKTGKYLPDFFQLLNLTNITAWEYFSKGYFNIQDESAGLACKLLDVNPATRVLDLCASPGGKTAYLANMMKDRGEIIAIDRFEGRIRLFNKNIERLGLTCIKSTAMDALEYDGGTKDKDWEPLRQIRREKGTLVE